MASSRAALTALRRAGFRRPPLSSGITTAAAQLKLAERTRLGIAAEFLADKPEKIHNKQVSRVPQRPAYLSRATKEVKALTRSGKFEEGWALYHATPEADTPLKNSALHLCAKAAWFDRGCATWESIGARDAISYNSMLDLCGRCRRLDFAESVLREMTEARIEQDIITHTAMVNACGMCGQPQKALEYFDAIPADILEQASTENKEVAYQTVMIALARAGDYARAREAFVQMTARGVSPNVAHFNALLTACAAGDDAETAQQVFDLMPKYGVVPNVANWTTLLKCNRRSVPDCQKVFQDMEAAGVRPSGITYSALLQAHVEARDGPGARALIQAKEGHLPPSGLVRRLTRQAYSLP